MNDTNQQNGGKPHDEINVEQYHNWLIEKMEKQARIDEIIATDYEAKGEPFMRTVYLGFANEMRKSINLIKAWGPMTCRNEVLLGAPPQHF